MSEIESGCKNDLTPRQKEVLDIYSGLHAINSHKMNSIPVYMKRDRTSTEE